MPRPSLASAAVALLVGATPVHAQLFDFEGADSPPGTATTFSLTRSGLTADFIDPPGTFVVVPTTCGSAPWPSSRSRRPWGCSRRGCSPWAGPPPGAPPDSLGMRRRGRGRRGAA